MKYPALILAAMVVIVSNGHYDMQRGKRRTIKTLTVLANKPVKTSKGVKKPQEYSI